MVNEAISNVLTALIFTFSVMATTTVAAAQSEFKNVRYERVYAAAKSWDEAQAQLSLNCKDGVMYEEISHYGYQAVDVIDVENLEIINVPKEGSTKENSNFESWYKVRAICVFKPNAVVRTASPK